MRAGHFSDVCRNKVHNCLGIVNLYVDNPNLSAQNFRLNMADIVASGIYYGFNVFLLWLEQLEWIVLFLNMLCLIHALLRTCIKQKECGKELINFQLSNNVKGYYLVPYIGLVYLEMFAFGVIFLAAIMLPAVLVLTLIMKCIFKGVITFIILITYVDGIISNFQNMYPAHPRIVQLT